MADATIGSITIPLPLNYVHEPVKLETRERTIDGSMIVNYAVTTGDVPITKYHFELPGITKSERLAIRAEALKTGSLDYIDYITIPEVLTCIGTTGTISMNLLRGLGSTSTGDISITLNDVSQNVTISTGTSPSSGEAYVTTGGTMTFGPCSAGSNNVVVNYIPNYNVHIISDSHEIMFKSSTGGHVTRYRLVMEEV